MSILTLILYGSHARKDNGPASDIDLLGVTDGSSIKIEEINKTNLSTYSLNHIIKKAQQGDLFVLHVVKEGKPLYDSDKYFDMIKENFKYQDNYEETIRQASDFGWFLYQNYYGFKDGGLVNKKIAWCVRTILIAKAAEKRTPIFSAEALSDFSEASVTMRIIKRKSRPHSKLSYQNDFGVFLHKFGYPKPEGVDFTNIKNTLQYFKRQKNSIAAKAVSALKKGSAHDNDGY